MEDKENTKENLDSKDQKNFSEPQKPKITDQSQANNTQKIKELNYKISVLIKGIKEEKEKTKSLSKEIELLKYDQISKDEQIPKLKSENESLNLFLSNNDPKTYFENITKINTNNINFNPEEYNLMKEENIKFKKENNILIEDNSMLKTKIEQLSEEFKLKEKNFADEINKLKKEKIALSNDLNEKQNRIEQLNNMCNDIKLQNNNKEGDIIKYQENEIKNKKIEEDLVDKIKNLEILNKKQSNEIIKLNNIIDNSQLDIDKYIFKGFVLEDDFNEKELFNKTVQLKFSSKDTFIKLKIDNINMNIDAQKIKFNFYKNDKERVMIFYENGEETNKGEKSALLCQFHEKENDYIYKFKKRMMDKYEENKENNESSSGGFLFGLLNG
jgi:hypothetical protein